MRHDPELVNAFARTMMESVYQQYREALQRWATAAARYGCSHEVTIGLGAPVVRFIGLLKQGRQAFRLDGDPNCAGCAQVEYELESAFDPMMCDECGEKAAILDE